MIAQQNGWACVTREEDLLIDHTVFSKMEKTLKEISQNLEQVNVRRYLCC